MRPLLTRCTGCHAVRCDNPLTGSTNHRLRIQAVKLLQTILEIDYTTVFGRVHNSTYLVLSAAHTRSSLSYRTILLNFSLSPVQKHAPSLPSRQLLRFVDKDNDILISRELLDHETRNSSSLIDRQKATRV